MNGCNRLIKIFLFFAFLSPISIIGQEHEYANMVGKPHFEPENFFIGDKVICTIRIETDDNSLLAWDRKINSIERKEFHIEDIKIATGVDGIKKIEIHFIPFYSQFKLSPLIIANIVIPEIDVFAFSNVSSINAGTMKIRSQKNIPYIEILFYLTLFLSLVFFIVVLTVYKKIGKAIHRLFTKKRQISPMAYANSVLKELQVYSQRINSKEFYTRLSTGIRNYLSLSFNEDFSSPTTSEILLRLPALVSDLRIVSLVKFLLEFSDEIKFSEKRTSFSMQRKDVNRFRRLVAIIQAFEKKKRLQKER